MKNNKAADSEWTRLCHELEAAKSDYEAAESAIACGISPDKGDNETKDALKASLQASKRMTEILEKMRKFHTGQ